MQPKNPTKYELYENSVQAPEDDIEFLENLFEEVRGFPARSLREDFCGTFKTSVEWVKRHPRNTALGLDIDPEPIEYGMRTHVPKLTPAQARRVRVLKQDVLVPTREKVDLIVACNFSFFVFKRRELLVKYFKACLRSLTPHGLMLLEMAGGPGMEEAVEESKEMKVGGRKVTYTWDQKSFDPITREGTYGIHYKVHPASGLKGQSIRDAFTYDWRLWTIPEVREAMAEAGFKQSCVFWESSHRGKGTGEFLRSEHGDNAWAWITYPIGVR